VARHWQTPLGLCFIDGGHAYDVALADYEAWSPHVAPGGVLVFHDVFEDPADGGQAPFLVWKEAAASGRFTPVSTTGSLRVLRRGGGRVLASLVRVPAPIGDARTEGVRSCGPARRARPRCPRRLR